MTAITRKTITTDEIARGDRIRYKNRDRLVVGCPTENDFGPHGPAAGFRRVYLDRGNCVQVVDLPLGTPIKVVVPEPETTEWAVPVTVFVKAATSAEAKQIVVDALAGAGIEAAI